MAKKDILNTLQKKYNHTKNSDQYDTWVSKATESYDFYDGKQWTSEETQALMDRGQPVIVINEIASRVDALASLEQTSRTRIAYKPRTFSDYDKQLAEGWSAYALQIQETNDISYTTADIVLDGVKGGIGWLNSTREEGKICLEWVDPFEMGWDVDDTTRNMTEQRYCWRRKWVDLDVAKARFPAHTKALDDLMTEEDSNPTQPIPVLPQSTIDDTKTNKNKFVDRKLNKVLIVEVQYKKPKNKYRFTDAENRLKESFDEAFANKNKADDTDVEEFSADEVWRGFFTQDVLLEHAPLETQTGEMSYIPYVYNRDSSGVPVGVIEKAKDPQRELNKRRSKMMHLLNTKGLIIEGGDWDDVEKLKDEMSQPNFVIMSKQGQRIQFQDNLQLADSQFRVMQQAKQEIQSATGVTDEFLGRETNATSGVAVSRRENASVRTHAVAMDKLKLFKKRLGRQLLAMMQTLDNTQFIAYVNDNNGEEKEFIFNKPYEIDGKQVYENDLSAADFDVVVEETADYDAPPQEVAERLSNMFMNGQLPAFLQLLQSAPQIVKQMGIRNVDEFAGKDQSGAIQQLAQLQDTSSSQ